MAISITNSTLLDSSDIRKSTSLQAAAVTDVTGINVRQIYPQDEVEKGATERK